MAKTSLHAFKAKNTLFVADWLKSKGLHKLCPVFEGIQEPFILSLACKSVVLNHVYIHSFRIIKATEKFPGGGGIRSPGMDLWWGIWTAFRPREGGIWTKILQKIQMPGVFPGGGDVEASIWLVHYQGSLFVMIIKGDSLYSSLLFPCVALCYYRISRSTNELLKGSRIIVISSWEKQTNKGGKFLKKLWCCVGGVLQDNLVLSTELTM